MANLVNSNLKSKAYTALREQTSLVNTPFSDFFFYYSPLFAAEAVRSALFMIQFENAFSKAGKDGTFSQLGETISNALEIESELMNLHFCIFSPEFLEDNQRCLQRNFERFTTLNDPDQNAVALDYLAQFANPDQEGHTQCLNALRRCYLLIAIHKGRTDAISEIKVAPFGG